MYIFIYTHTYAYIYIHFYIYTHTSNSRRKGKVPPRDKSHILIDTIKMRDPFQGNSGSSLYMHMYIHVCIHMSF